jgi:hypothetical protein
MSDAEHRLQNLIVRLLGPAAPELGCDECFERLDEFVEAELRGMDAAAAVPGMSAHLDGCPACREDHAGLLALVEHRHAAG